MVRVLLTAIFCWLCQTVLGTHVLGGEMYYDKLTGDQYRITLKLYRDCGPGNANNTGFDFEAKLSVFDGNGSFFSQHDVTFTGEQDLEVDLNTPCLQAPPSICATWTVYTSTLTLPPNATGYIISYQRCCRTPTTTNLPSTLQQGLTCTVTVPPSTVGINSSPRFSDLPPIAMCLGQDMSFDHVATDPDGDLLVYDLVTPFAGATGDDPAPYATPPPYAPIVWAGGYSGLAPLNGAPGLAIDPVSGELTAHPTLVGSFAIGIRVSEYRNGVLLGSSIRDLRLDVVPCNATIISAMEQQSVHCDGLTLQLENVSTNGDTWHWDFGVPGTDADTSGLLAPTWTYADTGNYAVTLIANPGWSCADTSVSHFAIHYPLDPYFVRPPIDCVEAPLEFVAEGRFTPNALVTWDMGDDATATTATGITTFASYNTPGTHPVRFTVQEFGCEASYQDSATVHPRIVLEVQTDTAGCVNTAFAFQALAQAWTPLTSTWNFGDGASDPSDTTEHIYTSPGMYDVSFTTSTSTGCLDSRTVVMPDHVQVFPEPVAEFTVHPVEVSLLDPVVEVTDHAQLAVTWEYTVDGMVVQVPSFTYEFDDAGLFEITQTVVSGANCSASTSHTVHVSDHLFFAPTAFTPDGDGVNDLFLPMVKGARLYDLVITDRWGTEHFHTNDAKAGWSGDGLPQGIYVYKVRLSEYGPISKEYYGSFALLR